jgi:hypothetical protein
MFAELNRSFACGIPGLFMCQDTVAQWWAKGYNWIGEIKSNRVVFYGGK